MKNPGDFMNARREVILSAVTDACWHEDADRNGLRSALESLLAFKNDIPDKFLSIILSTMYVHHCSDTTFHTKDRKQKARLEFVEEISNLGRDVSECCTLWGEVLADFRETA